MDNNKSTQIKQNIIGSDLHHVLARPSWIEFIICFFYFSSFFEKLWLLLYAIYPVFWYHVIIFHYERKIPERIIRELFCIYPGLNYLRLDEFIMELSNCQEPHLETWNIIYKLKKQGHIVCLTSNITTNYLQDLQKKWKLKSHKWQSNIQYSHLPNDLFSLLDFCFTSDPVDDFQRKPNVQYFERWFEYIDNHYGEENINLFFIDDSHKNISSALLSGKLRACHYKSPTQLIQNLQLLQLL